MPPKVPATRWYRGRVRTLLMLSSVAASFCALFVHSASAGPLQTGVWDNDTDVGIARMRAAGVNVVHTTLTWRTIAPERPACRKRPRSPAPANQAVIWCGSWDVAVGQPLPSKEPGRLLSFFIGPTNQEAAAYLSAAVSTSSSSSITGTWSAVIG